MITQELEKKIAPQTCPLCSMEQDVIVHGHKPVDPKDFHTVKVDEDHGYSFCNCHNIFFTDWKNINQEVYDPEYHKKYLNPITIELLQNYIKFYSPTIKSNLNGKFYGKALEIGAVAPYILDGLKAIGMKTYGLDIVDHSLGDHELIIRDFEADYDTFPKEIKSDLSIIWASHIFEHFLNPLAMVDRCHSMLDDGGLLFVAMPDPYFIDWDRPYAWGHWHLNEHHILWDMDSFVEVLESKGFEVIFAKHNVGYHFVCIGDFHILVRKK